MLICYKHGLGAGLELRDIDINTQISGLERLQLGLGSANEEMQSYNEELQSANEELETSKEELQIEGAVITFANINKAKQAQKALKEAHIRLTEAIVATVRQPVLVLNADLKVVSANRAFLSTFQKASDKVPGQLVYDLDNGQWDIPGLRKLLEKVLPGNSVVQDYVLSHEFESIGFRTLGSMRAW